jgi:hypothetical protein
MMNDITLSMAVERWLVTKPWLYEKLYVEPMQEVEHEWVISCRCCSIWIAMINNKKLTVRGWTPPRDERMSEIPAYDPEMFSELEMHINICLASCSHIGIRQIRGLPPVTDYDDNRL